MVATEENVFRDIASMAKLDGQIFENFEKALSIMEQCWRGRRSQGLQHGMWDWTASMASLGMKVLII
jgi:hypothetical protein